MDWVFQVQSTQLVPRILSRPSFYLCRLWPHVVIPNGERLYRAMEFWILGDFPGRCRIPCWACFFWNPKILPINRRVAFLCFQSLLRWNQLLHHWKLYIWKQIHDSRSSLLNCYVLASISVLPDLVHFTAQWLTRRCDDRRRRTVGVRPSLVSNWS